LWRWFCLDSDTLVEYIPSTRRASGIQGKETEDDADSKQTKANFLKILRRELAGYQWAKDEARFGGAMEAAEKTLNGSQTCVIDGPSWITAWKEIGMKRQAYL
jgi:hypothetical protein